MTANHAERVGQTRIEPAVEDLDLMRAVNAMLERNPAVGLAIGVIRDGELVFFHGHGVADIASGAPITPDTMFRIASITKTFTAIAVMQLWEEGKLDLDAPANDYLRSLHLTPARPELGQPTVRHLLTHTAGLGEVAHCSGIFRPDFGESVEADEPLPSLAHFYDGGPRVYAEPGTRFVYGNHSPATLGQLVEDLSEMELARYIAEYIFEPLGMTDSDLHRTHPVRSRLATGYEIGSRGIREVTERDMVTAGAASIYSTPRDMARYLSALLGGGRNTYGVVLRPETLDLMFAPQYQPDPRIPGMGLGFFRYRVGSHIAVGHQGSHPGFHSQILAVPEESCAVMMFTNGASQPDFWLPSEASRLLGLVLGEPTDAERPSVAHHPALWGDLLGWYRLSARMSDVRLRGMMGAGAEVFIRDGMPAVRFLTPVPEMARGFRLRPDDADDPFVFRIDLSDSGLDSMRLLFGQDSSGSTRLLHLDLMPLTLHKQPGPTNPRRWVTGAAVGGLAAGLIRLARHLRTA
jgi:CubicO group peptidase (beta-lactamase class C family)